MRKKSHVIPHENGVVQEVPPTSTNQDAMLECMNSADTHGISKDLLQRFQTDCHAAIALQLLLKLKRHLKIVFSLNDARYQAFSQNEPLKAGDALSKQNIPFNISETCTSLPSSYEEFAERCQDFKAALKEDTVDDTVYTAIIKKKRATPKISKVEKSDRETGGFDEELDEEE